MKKYYVFMVGAILATTIETQAQTKIGGAGAPDSSAMLEVTGGAGNNKGILLPKVSLANVSTWGLSGTTPVAGMFVYNTNASVTGGSGVGTYYWNGTQWVKPANTPAWGLTGNAGTNPATNFLGTTDNQPLVLRTNNTEHLRIDSIGQVGIGDATPRAPLSFASAVGPKIRLWDDGTDTVTYGFGISNASLNYHIDHNSGSAHRFFAGGSNGDGTELVRIQSNGNVGVGTASPAAKLDVNGAARISGSAGTPTSITGRSAAGDIGNVAIGAGLSLASGMLSATTQAGWNLTGNSGTNPATNYIGTTDAQPLVLRTNAAEHMRITTAGNIGINNGTPLAPLSFANSVGPKIRLYDNGTDTLTYGFGISNASLNYVVENSSSAAHRFWAGGNNSNGTVLMRIGGDGNVGIGNDAPLSPLSFASIVSPKISLYDGGSATDYFGLGISNNQLDYHVMPNGVHAFFAGGKNGNGAELMRIDGMTGNVGIGTNAPSFPLQVTRPDFSAFGGLAITDNAGANATNFTITPGYVGTDPTFGVSLDVTGEAPIAFVDSIRPAADARFSSGTASYRWLNTYGYNADFVGTARIAGSAGTPSMIMGRDASGYVSNISLGANLSLSGGVLSASGGNAGWGLTGNAGTNPATNFIGTTDAQPIQFRTNNTNNMILTTDGFLGLNTTIPSARLDVVNNSDASSDDIAIHRYASGNGAPRFTFFSASGSEAVPGNAFNGQILGTINWFGRVSGSNQNLNSIRSIYTGNGSTTLSELRFLTSGTLAITVDESQNVGIGNIGNPTERLHVNGNVLANSYLTASDRRLKTNIVNMKQGVAAVMKLRPVTYNMKADSAKATRFGFIAQELEEIMPEVVNKPKDAEHFYSVNYAELVPVLTKAIQEQQAQIEVLKVENEKLGRNTLTVQTQIEILKAENKELKENKVATAQLMERVKQMEQMMGINEIEGTSKVAGK